MKMTAKIESTGTLSLDIEGEASTENHRSVAAARRSVMNTAQTLATQTETSTNVDIEDPSGSRSLTVQTDGQIIEHDIPASGEAPAKQQVVTARTVPVKDVPAAVVTRDRPSRSAEPQDDPARTALEAEVEAVFNLETQPDSSKVPVAPETRGAQTKAAPSFMDAPATPTRRESMPSFVKNPEAPTAATQGFRGMLNQLGLSLAPSADEQAEREDEKQVARHWPGPRTIAVLNPKGGAGKTPTVICLSAVFARLGGSGVLAWDNNNSLGSLGWRTFDAGHESTVVDLLEQTEQFMTAGARAGDLSFYVHHQPADQYDVLRSDDRSGDQERHLVTGEEVDRLYAVAAKYYRLILMDSGNTERGDNWQAMISHADQVVIPVKSVNDAAEGAARVLSALRAGNDHARSLADRAVVIVLGCEPSHEKSKLNELAESFRPYVRAVATIPYDRALVEGRIRFSAMAPRTRKAWLRAGALIAGEL